MKQKRRHGHGRRLLEIGKDILIVFLVLVNVTLAIMCLPTKTLTQTKWLASALRPFAGLFGLNEAELTYTAPATGSAFIGAAQPIAVTLSTEAGRQSAQYDFAALDTLYGQYGGLLAQALESAETPQACAESAFYAALRKPGAAFCFPGQISPAVLGAWLNVRAPEGADAQWYVLALDGETVQLYLLGDGCYRAQTALSAETLAAELSAAVPAASSRLNRTTRPTARSIRSRSSARQAPPSAPASARTRATRDLFPPSQPRSASTLTATHASSETTARRPLPKPACACA